ncbi:hypothetical protein Taro_055941 [Colocasia esculenta]|uniref:Bifunctional inhibitor/plant lipid transfer protein/seed storage helical domain-containing protein n=1 Tax=Colocasia esculenta TaxID=4460 RepID=A0A843XUV5_COLES|nr:hypothetical protein [Colocasia esculenta]
MDIARALAAIGLSLLFFLSYASGTHACGACKPDIPPKRPTVPKRPPPRKFPPKEPVNPFCPRDALKLGACAALLGLGSAVVGTPPGAGECCAVLEGLAAAEVAACLCLAAKESVLGITVEWSVAVSALVSECKGEIPAGFKNLNPKLKDSSASLFLDNHMTNLIDSQDLIGFITGESSAPPQVVASRSPDSSKDSGKKATPNPMYVAWRCTDRLVSAWICTRLTTEALGLIGDLQTSKEIRDTLQTTYAHGSSERRLHLQRRLTSLTKEVGHTIHEYIREFKGLCDDLAMIGRPLSDEDKVMHLLNGLGAEYLPFTTSAMRPPLQSYNVIVPQLIDFDTHVTKLQPSNTPAFSSGRRPSWRQPQAVELVSASRHGRQH